MDKPISTAFVLSAEEDMVLRVEAAKSGLSKTKMAQHIIKEWISSQDDNTTIRQRITNIASRIAETKDNETLFNALESIVSNSCAYMEVQVKLGEGDLLGPIDTKGLEARQQNILIKLNADIEVLNMFCEAEGLTLLTKLSPGEFAFELVREYFENRVK